MSDKLKVTLPKTMRNKKDTKIFYKVSLDFVKKKKDETGTRLAVGVLNIRLIVKSL